MSAIFEKRFEVGWRDVDTNGHLANTAYIGYAVDTRIAFFLSQGFPPMNFARQGFGPVVKTDFVEYFRESVMLDELRVTIENGGNSDDFSRFRVVNNFYNTHGEPTGRVTSVGGWLNLKERKLMEPPEAIKEAWRALSRTDDFEGLRSSIRKEN